MSGAINLLARIEASGVAFALEPDGRIRLDPIDALPSGLLAEAKIHRDELAALLARREGSDGSDKSDVSGPYAREKKRTRKNSTIALGNIVPIAPIAPDDLHRREARRQPSWSDPDDKPRLGDRCKLPRRLVVD